MLAHTARRNARGVGRVLTALACLSATVFSSSCDKVPLLAPTGSVITLFATATTVPSNGSMEIVATVIEQGSTTAAPSTPTTPGTPTTPTTPTSSSSPGAGTPVHNGTVVTFTTTIGRIEPAEARTNNGQARVTFFANGQSGTATITAFSGGASGKIENLKVGSAGADHILLTASPQALPCSGGPSTVSARVEDVSGVGLAAVPVTFTTTRGTVNPGTVITDSNGTAATTLTTSQEATVTANAAGKTATATVTLSPRTGISVTPPTGQIAAGTPTSFTVAVASTANIANVVFDFGDGTSQNLGPISGSTTVPHTYRDEGTFTVSATASDASGCSERVSTGITILPAQPPSVTITAPNSATVNTNVIVSASVSGATSTIIRYEWNFGPDALPQTVSTSSRQTTVRWLVPGTKTFSVRVIQASGPEGDQVASITIVQ
ncbi:MAG TPA: PKD domain-containing protein [Vicinamibacterales bacterium]|nr:PKD domain-containing protein [Vicinamibacterales bacterium]